MLSDQDWTAPPVSDPPEEGFGREWRVAPKEGKWVIASVAPGLNVHAHHVATVEREEDADLIVALYEQYRKTR